MFFLSLLYLIGIIAIFYLLYRWSKELDNRSFTLFLYFMISTYTAPLYTRYTENEGKFELWFPLGFLVLALYMKWNNKAHPAKWKASLLGLTIALIKIIQAYF